jgi:hypothetical protein
MPMPAEYKAPNPPELHANIAPLERLLSHNQRAKIIWAHAGADNLGYRTPELSRRLLQAHPNLYMEIKYDPNFPGKDPPIVNGKLKPEWFKSFPISPTALSSAVTSTTIRPRPRPWRAGNRMLS